MELLIRAKRLLPIFDGFDEMATRVTKEELPERLASLLAVAGSSGRVVISSRDQMLVFVVETELDFIVILMALLISILFV